MSATIEHYGPGGRVLRFANPSDLYPVNRYQSLVLATSAHLEAMDLALERGRAMADLRAIEFCCGGGAASILLKAAGLRYVKATDVNLRALEACRHNAAINEVVLDEIVPLDLLAPPPSSARFDLAVCNSPCGSGIQVEASIGDDLRTAIDGGPGGIRFIRPLFRAARDSLAPGGRLVFIITSTMAFGRVQEELDREFAGRWRLDPTTPVAQPYVEASSPEGRHWMEKARLGEAFVWQGDDGRIWRLSWVIVAENRGQAGGAVDRRLWLSPRYYDPPDPGYASALARFQRRRDR